MVQQIVGRYDEPFYSRVWSVVAGPDRDVCVVCCGTTREQSVEWLLDQLRDIATLPPPIDVEDRVRGLFLANHEMTGTQEWQIRDGQLVMKPSDRRYDYLYA